jgi:hypothetical protein
MWWIVSLFANISRFFFVLIALFVFIALFKEEIKVFLITTAISSIIAFILYKLKIIKLN